MVGIVIASHGDFAHGIKQSGEMIFGQQEDVASVSLIPSEGPESFRQKVIEEVKAFKNPDEVLFLVDLWGGTPFNQISSLVKEHENWAIVTGLNLPMLLEAYGSRMGSDVAKDVAKEILHSAREGVKAYPENLEEVKKEEPKAPVQKSAEIPEGTVLGDGKIKYVLCRIDTRLLHGQVATSWTKTTGPDRIIVVSDNVSKDNLRKSMIENAAPPGVYANVVPIDKMVEVDKDPRFGNTKALILFETPQDALEAIEKGMDIKEINLGSMAHSKGKVAVTTTLAFNRNDIDTVQKLIDKGVKFDVRKVPADNGENIDNILKKARNMIKE